MKNDINYSSWEKEDLAALENSRKCIDFIDEKLLTLLSERTEASVNIGNIKKKYSSTPNICDKTREEQILQRLFRLNKVKDNEANSYLSEKNIRDIWLEIIACSREMQEKLYK